MRPEIYLPVALLFLAQGFPSNAQNEGEVSTSLAPEPAAGPAPAPLPAPGAQAAAADAAPVLYYDVGRVFSLNCSAPDAAAAPAPAPASYRWTKNGTAVESVWDLTGRYKLEEGGAVLTMVGRTHEDDFGNYSCGRAAWDVRGRPHAKLPSDTNVVEEQSLKLVCKLVGKPYPAVRWTFTNSSDAANATVEEALGARVTLAASEQKVAGAALTLAAAQRSDAGLYRCVPDVPEGVGALSAATTLRVKDMYAALWPFLGICLEVFVLCAVILVYEKRRTKPDLDDSDTDNHDQKKS